MKLIQLVIIHIRAMIILINIMMRLGQKSREAGMNYGVDTALQMNLKN